MTAWVAVLLLVGAASAEPRTVSVQDRLGGVVAGATAACLEPASRLEAAGAPGRFRLSESCTRVRCEAPGYLPAEATVEATTTVCVPRPGLEVSGELVRGACADCTVALQDAAGSAVVPAMPLTRATPEAPAAFRFPLVPAGRYRVELARASDGWTCGVDLGAGRSGTLRLGASWEEPVTIAGRVVTADDRPLPGVRIRASTGPAEKTPAGQWTCGPDALIETAANDQGRFFVRARAGADLLVVAGDWDEPRGIAAERVTASSDAGVELRPSPPVRARASVLDRQDAPVPCTARLVPDDRTFAWLRRVLGAPPLEGSCSSTGALEIGPFLTAPFELRVRPSGGLPMLVREAAPRPGTTADLGVLLVDRGARVAVQVVDPAGAPVAGAEIVASCGSGVIVQIEASSGADGLAILEGVPEHGECRATVEARGLVPASIQGLRPGEEPFTATLERGARIAGTVVDLAGESVAGASVTARGAQERQPRTASTSEDGTFELDGIAPGEVVVDAWTEGGARSRSSTPLTLEGSQVVEGLTLTLDDGPRTRGRVLRPDGSPAGGARVIVLEEPALSWGVDASTTTGVLARTDGTFEIPAVRGGQVVVATAAGAAAAVARGIAPDAALPVELRLGEPGALRVHLPRQSGEAELVVEDGLGIGHRMRVAGPGEIHVVDLAPGEGRAGLTSGRTVPVQLVAGAVVDVSLLVGAVIEGAVRSARGPVSRAAVFAMENTERQFGTDGDVAFTDERGRFRLEGVGAGPRILAVRGDGARAERAVVVPEEGVVTVDVEIERHALDVQVLDAGTGAPLADVHLSLDPVDADYRGNFMRSASVDDAYGFGYQIQGSSTGGTTGRTDGSGRDTLLASLPGEHVLSAHHEGYEPWSRPIQVGGEGSLVVRLEPRGAELARISVRVVTEPTGLRGRLELATPRGRHSYGGVLSERMEEEVPAGTTTISFVARGYGAAVRVVELQPGEKLDVTLEVPRGGAVVVPVGPGDTPPAIALVDATGFEWAGLMQGEATRVEQTQVGRRFVYEAVPPGEYRVTVQGVPRSPVLVEPGATVTAWE